MIYEIRSYRVKPGSIGEVEKRFGEAYEVRKKYSELTGFFHTEIGPLNQIVHIWGYPSLEARSRVRADASKESAWPPKIQEFITAMQSEIVVPFPGSPEPTPGTMGPVFSTATTIARGRCRASSSLRPGRCRRGSSSPLMLVGTVEFGTANAMHIWAYKSLEHRSEIRNKAREVATAPRAAATRSPRTTRSCCPRSSRRSSRAGAAQHRGAIRGSDSVGGCFQGLIRSPSPPGPLSPGGRGGLLLPCAIWLLERGDGGERDCGAEAVGGRQSVARADRGQRPRGHRGVRRHHHASAARAARPKSPPQRNAIDTPQRCEMAPTENAPIGKTP